MGMASTRAAGATRRRGGRRRGSAVLISEINVTPFVDVMLVLLIIFMVAAPLLTVGVPVDLPETRASEMNAQTQPITVSINSEGQVFIQETEVAMDDIVPRLEAIAKTGYEERIFVRGDQNADYGTILRVMGRLNAAGFKNIGLVSLQEQSGV
jgi:biopolymer transport protein TolR